MILIVNTKEVDQKVFVARPKRRGKGWCLREIFSGRYIFSHYHKGPVWKEARRRAKGCPTVAYLMDKHGEITTYVNYLLN